MRYTTREVNGHKTLTFSSLLFRSACLGWGCPDTGCSSHLVSGNGYECSSSDEFFAATLRLATDGALRGEMSRRSREVALSHDLRKLNEDMVERYRTARPARGDGERNGTSYPLGREPHPLALRAFEHVFWWSVTLSVAMVNVYGEATKVREEGVGRLAGKSSVLVLFLCACLLLMLLLLLCN